jgi:hypothetical protein
MGLLRVALMPMRATSLSRRLRKVRASPPKMVAGWTMDICA